MWVLAIGDINVDIIARTKMPHKGKQVVPRDFEFHGGGCAANFAFACARLGAKSKIVGKVGADFFGDLVLDELRKGSVDVRDVAVTEGRTGITFAMSEKEERSFVTFRGENANFVERDIPLTRLDYDIVHMPAFFLLEKLRPSFSKLATRARNQGAFTSIDTGWDPFGKWSETEFLLDAIKSFDVFMPNLEEARSILGAPVAKERTLMERLFRLGPKVVVLKKGEKGSIVGEKGKKLLRVPPFRVKAVDTTGAGDVFGAAFMMAYLNSKDVEAAARFASAAASISVSGVGWSSYPTWDQVNNVLRKSGFRAVLFKLT